MAYVAASGEQDEKEARAALYAAITKEARKISDDERDMDNSERLRNLAQAFAFTARPGGAPRT